MNKSILIIGMMGLLLAKDTIVINIKHHNKNQTNEEFYSDTEQKYIDAYKSDKYKLKKDFNRLRVIPYHNGTLSVTMNYYNACEMKIINAKGKDISKRYIFSKTIKAEVKSDKTYYVIVTKKSNYCKWVEIIIP